MNIAMGVVAAQMERERRGYTMRRPDWDVRLATWATRRNGELFAWGQTDCAMLCFEAYDAMTGRDLAGAHRGRWRNRFGAIRFQVKHRTDVVVTLLAAGCVDVRPGYQQRGDFVIVERAPFPHGHVCFGGKAISSSPGHLVSWVRMNFGVPQGMRVLRVP